MYISFINAGGNQEVALIRRAIVDSKTNNIVVYTEGDTRISLVTDDPKKTLHNLLCGKVTDYTEFTSGYRLTMQGGYTNMNENNICDKIDEIYRRVLEDETFQKYNMKPVDNTYKDEYGTYITEMAFGNNGTSDWPGYLTHLASLFIEIEKDENVNDIYLTKIDVDTIDDVAYAYIATVLNE